MDSSVKNKINEPKEIQFLTFNLMGTRIGMDMEQIDEMLQPEQAKSKELKVFRFHEKMPFRGGTVVYKSPRVLLLKEEKVTTGIIIDQPEDIIPVPIDCIQPLPPLLETCNNSGPFWGVTINNKDIILLVDFYKLLAVKTIKNT